MKTTKRKSNFDFLFFFQFKKIWKSIGVNLLSLGFIIMNLLFTFLGVNGALNKDPIEDIGLFKMLNFIFSHVVLGVMIIFIVYTLFNKQIKSNFINIEIQSGKNIYISFLLRFIVSYLYIFIIISINLIITELVGLNLDINNNDIKYSLITSTALFFYLSSFIFYSVCIIFSLLLKSTPSLVVNMIFVFLFALSSVTAMGISLMSKENKNNINLNSKSLFELQINQGQEFYKTFSQEEEYKDLFDTKKVQDYFKSFDIDGLEWFNYEYNKGVKNKSESDLKGVFSYRYFNSGQLNYDFRNSNSHYNKDFFFNQMIEDIYEVFKDDKGIPISYEGLGMSLNDSRSSFLINSSSSEVIVDLKPTISYLKKNPKTSRYEKILDYINHIYNDMYDYFGKMINQSQGFLRKERINSDFEGNTGNECDSKIKIIRTLWVDKNIDCGNIGKISENDQEAIKVYYEHPELMIINFLLFQTWRNSMYIDTKLNLNNTFNDPSISNQLEETREKQVYLKKYNEFIDFSKKKINSNFLNSYTYVYFASKPSLLTDFTNVGNGMLEIYPSFNYKISENDLLNYENSPFANKDIENLIFNNNNIVIITSIIISFAFIGLSMWLFKKQLIK
ncbi:hypothetical protein [Spiroplasma sp. BIUS-1]|uniref:hypothetical protein n=1 Tax=Spiroplasma sp. BIUS-1 TaxID=216964 RepID=UPI001396E7FF|nr:hypothetical protein [Spiroplasma sp. BIUS-1]QHX36552.1 hypothetical protein SBIUS_v1c02990 [Spiroplasma sp. BIUS-1]